MSDPELTRSKKKKKKTKSKDETNHQNAVNGTDPIQKADDYLIKPHLPTAVMDTCNHGVGAKVNRVVMDRDPREWGLGPTASMKTELIADGKLSKHGYPKEDIPAEWMRNVVRPMGGYSVVASLAAANEPNIENAESVKVEGDKKKKKKKKKKKENVEFRSLDDGPMRKLEETDVTHVAEVSKKRKVEEVEDTLEGKPKVELKKAREIEEGVLVVGEKMKEDNKKNKKSDESRVADEEKSEKEKKSKKKKKKKNKDAGNGNASVLPTTVGCDDEASKSKESRRRRKKRKKIGTGVG